MRKPVLACLLLALLTAVLLPMQSINAASQSLDHIVAVVESDVILDSELTQRVQEIKARLQDQTPPVGTTLRDNVLERMITESIELQMAQRAGIRVSDAQLNSALANIARQNDLAPTEFRAAIIADGLSWEGLRDQIRRELTINQLRQRRLGSRIAISDQELDEFMRSEVAQSHLAPDYRLGHILVAIDRNTPSDAAKRETQEILNKLRAGVDFSKLAAEYSDSETALSGGDLGWRKAAQLPTLFADVVTSMQVGDVADPIVTPGGIHIIKVLETRGSEQRVVDQTHARHILVKANEIRSERETKALAQDIYSQLSDDGTAFEELARIYSEDPGSALQGGDLGWVNPGMMVPEFEEVMDATQVGSLSKPFKSQFGWHILQVMERRSQDMSAEFQKEKARDLLQRRKFDEELDGWLREIRQDAYVEIKS